MKIWLSVLTICAITCLLSFISQNKNLEDEKKMFCEKVNILCDEFAPNTEKIINTELEYKNLFSKSVNSKYCIGNIPPTIDFTKYTLIGVYTSTKGCNSPKPEYYLSSSSDGSGVSFSLTITSTGLCKKLNYYKIWCIIDKITDPNKISFSIIKKDEK